MKNPSLFLLGWCLLAPALHAFAPHPSVLTVKYGDNMLPVVRVTSSGPYVIVDGKEKLIRSSPIYLVQEAANFSDNFVQTKRGALGGTMKATTLDGSVMDPSAPHLGNLSFATTVVARQDIKSGFAVMVFYTDETFAEHPAHASPAEVFVRALPELPAGKSVDVKFFAAILPRAMEARFFVHIFDDSGREVQTSGADHAAVPVSTPKPVFNSTAELPKGEVIITLTIEPDGTVSAVDAGNVANDSARNSLVEAMSGWLFLPKLKAGQPVSNYMQVPLQF